MKLAIFGIGGDKVKKETRNILKEKISFFIENEKDLGGLTLYVCVFEIILGTFCHLVVEKNISLFKRKFLWEFYNNEFSPTARKILEELKFSKSFKDRIQVRVWRRYSKRL